MLVPALIELAVTRHTDIVAVGGAAFAEASGRAALGVDAAGENKGARAGDGQSSSFIADAVDGGGFAVAAAYPMRNCRRHPL